MKRTPINNHHERFTAREKGSLLELRKRHRLQSFSPHLRLNHLVRQGDCSGFTNLERPKNGLRQSCFGHFLAQGFYRRVDAFKRELKGSVMGADALFCLEILMGKAASAGLR